MGGAVPDWNCGGKLRHCERPTWDCVSGVAALSHTIRPNEDHARPGARTRETIPQPTAYVYLTRVCLRKVHIASVFQDMLEQNGAVFAQACPLEHCGLLIGTICVLLLFLVQALLGHCSALFSETPEQHARENMVPDLQVSKCHL